MLVIKSRDGTDLLDELEDVSHGTLELLFIDGMRTNRKMADD